MGRGSVAAPGADRAGPGAGATNPAIRLLRPPVRPIGIRMATPQLKALAAARARVARLEQAIARQLHRELAALPARYGFPTVEAFADAVQAASRPAHARPAKAGPRRRRRAKITAATRAKVKQLVEAGQTGRAIAQAAGISLPSVHNIKQELGLVTPRK